MNSTPLLDQTRVKTGVAGLDDVLNGGMIPLRGYVVRGGPGTGKTTLGLHFLSEGAAQGEKVLFITLGENVKDLVQNAASINIETKGMDFLDLSPKSDFFAEVKSYDLFSPAEIERDPITKKIIEHVRRIKPSRVFLDSTSHLRYLAIDNHQFRKQLLSFMRFLLEQEATVLFTSEGSASTPDDDVMYLSDGVISLEQTAQGRTLEVNKFRGSSFKSGKHTLCLSDYGYQVFVRLTPAEHGREHGNGVLSSGIAELDHLLKGGIEQSTVTIVTGPAGAGKTTLGLQFLAETARKKMRSVLFTFEESRDSLIRRAAALQIPIDAMLNGGYLEIIPVEPLLLSADEISHKIRIEVEEKDTRMIMVDSVAGYHMAARGNDLSIKLRGIFKYLANMGVTVIAVKEVESITGEFRATEQGISFMTDNIIFLRYIEVDGEVKRAIGILKKRMGDFERTLREFDISGEGIKVGTPLKHLRGILRGIPERTAFTDTSKSH